MSDTYDAVLLVSFGGPERSEDVLPFLERVTEGRQVPRERLEEVAEHYFEHGGRSPINDLNRDIKHALEAELSRSGPQLPVYWGNRNWDPLLADTLRQMRDDGVQRALCFVTSAYSSYSGCRQYREDLAAARAEVGDGAPELDKIRVFYNHPDFIDPQVDAIVEALEALDDDVRAGAQVVFVTHSIPLTMARHSDYEAQHLDACRLVMRSFPKRDWDLVYCSRSGPPSVPWLEPDVNDHLERIATDGVPAAILVPIGFVSDHMEVIHDLDVEAVETAERVGLPIERARTAGTDDRFIAMIVDLVRERVAGAPARSLGTRGPSHDACPIDCCAVPGQELRPTVASAAPASRPSA